MKQTPRLICLRPVASRCLAGFTGFSHLLAVMSLFLTDLHDMARAVLIMLIVFSYYLVWSRLIARTSAKAVMEADWLADDNWQITDGKGRKQQVTSWNVLLNSPVLVMLSFESGYKRAVTLIICPDNVDGETRRQLRVRLETSALST